jgi:hypothetical protein
MFYLHMRKKRRKAIMNCLTLVDAWLNALVESVAPAHRRVTSRARGLGPEKPPLQPETLTTRAIDSTIPAARVSDFIISLSLPAQTAKTIWNGEIYLVRPGKVFTRGFPRIIELPMTFSGMDLLSTCTVSVG